MSEYQYYEFRAVDRTLTEREMRELRALSTRAKITPTSFQNVYNFGDFRGSPSRLMEKYFDAFVYVANWGTHEPMLRLPASTLDTKVTKVFCPGGRARLRKKGRWIILEYQSEDEEADWEDGEGWIGSLLPIREELGGGDLRALYLGWLSCVQAGDVDEGSKEPPVPPGLRELTAAQKSFVKFLRINARLLSAAAVRSAPLRSKARHGGLARLIRALPDGRKDALLARVAEGGVVGRPKKSAPEGGPRTAGDLLASAGM